MTSLATEVQDSNSRTVGGVRHIKLPVIRTQTYGRTHIHTQGRTDSSIPPKALGYNKSGKWWYKCSNSSKMVFGKESRVD